MAPPDLITVFEPHGILCDILGFIAPSRRRTTCTAFTFRNTEDMQPTIDKIVEEFSSGNPVVARALYEEGLFEK
jgi:hypothetical protein